VLQPSSAVPGPLGLHDPYLVEDGVGGVGAQTDDRRSLSPRLNSPRLASPRLASSRLSPRLSPRPGTSGSVRSNDSRVSNASRASFAMGQTGQMGRMGRMGRQAGKPPRRPLPPTGGVSPLPSRMVRIEGDSAESPNLFPGASGATLAGAARSGVGAGAGAGAGSGGAHAGARARTGTPQSNSVAPETITRIQVTRAMRIHPLSTGVYDGWMTMIL
jgi:hypothetical protein